MRYRIRRLGLDAPVQKLGVRPGTWMPAPCPVADKIGGKKGKVIAYGNKELFDLYELNGFNAKVFHFILHVGGWLFNVGPNKQFATAWTKLFGLASYIPYPLPAGKKALAEKIYCEGNIIDVDRVSGGWVHVKPGIGKLSQVRIGTAEYQDSAVYWRVPAGWIKKSLVVKL